MNISCAYIAENILNKSSKDLLMTIPFSNNNNPYNSNNNNNSSNNTDNNNITSNHTILTTQ